MFNNVGGKIKGWAKWTFYVVAIVSIALGIVCMCTIYDGIGFLVGIPVIIFGILSARISSLLLYGFGELVSNSYNKGGIVVEGESPRYVAAEASKGEKEEPTIKPASSESKSLKRTKIPKGILFAFSPLFIVVLGFVLSLLFFGGEIPFGLSTSFFLLPITTLILYVKDKRMKVLFSCLTVLPGIFFSFAALMANIQAIGVSLFAYIFWAVEILILIFPVKLVE